MGLLDDADDDIFKRHQDLCGNLNMDKDAADEAWQSYETIRQNYTLEGDQLHWLGCALYVACRKSSTPTVGRSGAMVEGNCVSLTRLLRLCKLSLIQFFSKSKKWADMANMPPEFRSKIDRLERNFAVSMVIFKKYQPIFVDMFHNPADDQLRQPRSRKQRSMPCTAAKVFDFCWTLFVCVKGKFPGVSDDLVNSYHLLLACCDLMFANAILADRRDILNPKFPGLPANFWDQDYTPPSQAPCIINQLCKKHDGISVEAMGIKEYSWKTHIKRLFDTGVLKGESSNLSGILEQGRFDYNYKAVSRAYEEYVLSEGDFDERIFLVECKRLRALGPRAKRCHLVAALIRESRPELRDRNSGDEGDDAHSDIGTPTKACVMGEFAEKLQAKRAGQKYSGGMQQLAPSTPLTGRRYLKSKELQLNVTPVSTATQSVSRLQTLLAGRQASPSETLLELFRSCSSDPKEKVAEWVREMGHQFCTRYTQHTDDHPGKHMDFARKRLQLGESLYYKLLENILVEERKKKPEFDLTNLLEQEVFHQSLFACCLELVIYSYNSQRTFPWVLDALSLEPYFFYKVIEVIVKVEDQLSRDMVKHLNLIEEQIIEALAWRSESPLWENIRNSGLPVPSCEDVCLPGQLDDMSSVSCPNPVIRRLTTGIDRSAPPQQNPQQSPISSVSERFQSPVGSSLAKKRLFTDGPALNNVIRTSLVKPGQSLLQTSAKTMSINIQKGENGQRYIPISYVPGTGSVIIQAQPTGAVKQQASPNKQQPLASKEKKPRRTGSLGLFFRKFYNLASVRMQELCCQLEVKDMELKRKIWTCFEHSVIQHSELMQDRHLDQILMCSVYVICKVSQSERTFTDIMRCYRLQPQAASHVYRSVLLCSKRRRGSGSSSNGTSNTSSPVPSDAEVKGDETKDGIRSSSTLPVTHPPSAPPTPTHLAGTGTSFEFEDRGDLIKFYNTIYVQKVRGFALKFSSGVQPENVTLSPLPLGKNQPMSPCRRVSDKHTVYIRSLESKPLPTSPSQPLSYCFSRSPAKDLRAINTMIQIDSKKVGKRLPLDDAPDADASPAKQHTAVVTRRLQGLLDDRLGQAQD
ncbi:retinoblastoma-like protein 1 isoform X2 [Periplaneta americana]|uniref:retinoblastoma-like protein 1 isoform X2 n=1 Tax=Periplaneta americana TaxID=6978 RepID=UPI0037E71EFE